MDRPTVLIGAPDGVHVVSLVRADAAMYAAKALGKGTFAYFDPRMPLRTWAELEAAG